MRTDRSEPETCEGTLERRAFLRAGLTGLSTLTLSDLLRLRGSAGPAETSGGPSIIVLWLWGGPSHMETFDLKPDAPAEYRGEFGRSRRTCPASGSASTCPRLAGIADKFGLIRSCATTAPATSTARTRS